ncbi:MAG: radical SAM protein [Chitinophagaceae bacterium]
MNKILFSHSYFLRFDPKQWATGQPYAPIGTLYAASLMRENGYSVSFFDTMFSNSSLDIVKELETHPDFFVLYDDGFNYLTKMCLTNMREAAFEMIQFAKRQGCTVIISSSDATDHFEKYLEKGADYIILGEAEITLLELVNAIKSGKQDILSIPGLAFKHNDCVIKTVKRNVLKELDSLPLPAWDLVDIKPYREMWLRHHGYFSLNIATTRGCPFKCNWCAKPIYGNRYNSRSPQHVIKELKMLEEMFGFDHIWFCDDIFGLTPGWVNTFADFIKQEKLSFKFKIQARVDLLLQENYIKDLARAGCDNIWMGAESGSQKILDAMDKGTTIEQIYQSSALIRKHGMKPSFFVQFGYPGETKEDIRKTIGMINELLPHEIGISVSYPLPGTLFFEKVKADLKEKTNWTDSDELALMFRNTYQPAFYKQLHRYVHMNYRSHVAWKNLKQVFQKPASVSSYTLKKAASLLYYIPAGMVAKLKLHSLQKTGMS